MEMVVFVYFHIWNKLRLDSITFYLPNDTFTCLKRYFYCCVTFLSVDYFEKNLFAVINKLIKEI